MRNKVLPKRTTLIFVLTIFIVSLTMISALPQSQVLTPQAKQQSNKVKQAEDVDTSKFPVLDFVSTEIGNEKERAKREAKGKKYNTRHVPPITESKEKIFANIDWDAGLPAFPIEQSAAVIVGKVNTAQAYLSQDKTSVYSEFEIQIEQVIKRDLSIDLAPGSSVLAERAGGRVRFPSGKIMVSVVSHQQMPQVGTRYVLFLTHQPLLGPVSPDDFFILTGYELRDGQVFPLDKLHPGHPITAYEGANADVFLNDLTSALLASSPQA
jgi:hypothetical protein